MPMLLLGIYLVSGFAVAIFVFVRKVRVAGRERLASSLLMVVLWPFLVPTLLSAEPVHVPRVTPDGAGPMAERIEALARHSREAAAGRAERPILEAFLERLRRLERSLRDMDQAIRAAPQSVRPKLEALRARSCDKLTQDAELLEELIAQLTVLRFAEMSEFEAGEMDESRILGLLSQIKALVELNAEARG